MTVLVIVSMRADIGATAASEKIECGVGIEEITVQRFDAARVDLVAAH